MENLIIFFMLAILFFAVVGPSYSLTSGSRMKRVLKTIPLVALVLILTHYLYSGKWS